MALQEHELEFLIMVEGLIEDTKPPAPVDVWLQTDEDIERVKEGLAEVLGREVVEKRVKFHYIRDRCH